jgi:hypothetical protein
MIEDKLLSTKQLAVVFRTIADEFFPLSNFPIHILDFPEDDDDDEYDRVYYAKKRIRNKILSVADDMEKLND